MIDVDHSSFDDELPGLLKEIEDILPDGDSHKIDNVLERLKVGNTPVDTRFPFHSASQTYNDLDDVQQNIVQNFKDALTMRGLLTLDEYLTGVVRGSALDEGTFGCIYEGKWDGKQVAVKTFCPVTPQVFFDLQCQYP